jgi:hypothetical protein
MSAPTEYRGTSLTAPDERTKLMKKLLSLTLTLSLTSFVANVSMADMVIYKDNEWNPSGFVIKVIQNGDRVSFQAFDLGGYLKNLGDQETYSATQLDQYSKKTRSGIKWNARGEYLSEGAGTVIGAAIGFFGNIALTRALPNRTLKSGLTKFLVGTYGTAFATVLGGYLGNRAGKAIRNTFLVSSDDAQLRAIETNRTIFEKAAVKLITPNPANAINELDAALKECVAQKICARAHG